MYTVPVSHQVSRAWAAPLAGTINITTTDGIFYSADVAPGFSSSGPSIFYDCENDPDSPYARWNSGPVAGVEILRVPVVEGEFIAESYINTAGVDVDFSGPVGGANVGCNIDVEPQVRCNCFANWAHEIVSIFFMIDRTFEGAEADTLEVSAQPNSLDLGQVASITVIARDSLGSEVGLPDTEPITISISDATWGLLSYQGSTGSGFAVPYSDARGGAVSFVSDSTVVSLPADTTVAISAVGGGVLGVGEVTIRKKCIPDRLDVMATPPRVGRNQQSQVSVIGANDFGCEEISLPPTTPMALSIQDDHFGMLDYGGNRGIALGGIPYSAAEAGAVVYDRNGRRPYYDFPVEVMATGGGLSGTGKVIAKGSERPERCQTGNPMLDDRRVQNGLLRLWRAATLNQYYEQYNNPNDRREFCGYIIPQAGGGFQMLANINPARYPDDTHTSVSAQCPVPAGGLPPDAVMVHTHPFYFGDRTERGKLYDDPHVLATDPEDYIALQNAGLSQGLVMDGREMRFFDPARTPQSPIPRCGY